jgi:hypothetical protein
MASGSAGNAGVMALKTGKKSLIGFALREKVMLNPLGSSNDFKTRRAP